MSTIVLIHGGLGAEMDADRFWLRPGVVARLQEYGHRVHAPDRPHHEVSWSGQAAQLVPALPSVPPNRFHQRSTVDALLRLLPEARELPGSPEPPHPSFASFVESFVGSVAGFAA